MYATARTSLRLPKNTEDQKDRFELSLQNVVISPTDSGQVRAYNPRVIELSRDPVVAERQIEAIIFYLTTLGHIDSEFDLREKAFVRKFLRELVTARVDAQGDIEPELRYEQIEQQHEHYIELFGQVDFEVKSLFTEVVADGENQNEFVISKLKLRCFELLEGLSESNRTALMHTVDSFIHADGVIAPEELRFRNELAALLGSPQVAPDDDSHLQQVVEVDKPTQLTTEPTNHPFFTGFEHHYSSDPTQARTQIEADLRLLKRVEELWTHQRQAGQGRLQGCSSVADLKGEAFLDNNVYAVPGGGTGDYELIVLGDLHGCYSCLKAAVMQSKFMDKVRAHRNDPENNPDVRLILLGDYIDRGHFSFNGVLRAVLKLYETVPDNVFVLRGNHEYYIRHEGRIYGGVRPSDAINRLQRVLPDEVFAHYLDFFEQMPHVLLFDNLLFVHGGMPRDQLLADRWRDLSSLNDPDIRFQMLWSDPSSAERVPDDLQQSSARFSFGRQQFRRFMGQIGCSLMVRGHEKVIPGFRVNYPRDDIRLVTVFSAGGVANEDLPEDSNYRDVRPMALTIARRGGETRVTPWAIDYRSYQDPDHNAFRIDPPI